MENEGLKNEVSKVEDDKIIELEKQNKELKKQIKELETIKQDMTVLKYVMWNYVGLIRTKERLKRAMDDLRFLLMDVEEFYRNANLTKELIELRNAIQTGLQVAHSAWLNNTSRGTHYRIS